MFSWIAGTSSFTDGILSTRSRFGGTSDRCVTTSRSGEVGGVGTCGLGALRHATFEEAQEGDGDPMTEEGGR